MPPTKKREPKTRDISVDKLLDEFSDPDSVPSTIAVYKHKALETLNRYRKERPRVPRKAQGAPVVSEKITPLKRCENCYFCIGNKQVGGSSWCHCTNLSRSSDTSAASSWVKSRLNPPCWRREEPLAT